MSDVTAPRSARSSSSSRSTGASGAGRVVSTVVTPVVYLLALGWGSVCSRRLADLPAGVSYLEFVAPGLLAATAMQLASFEASWPVLSAIKWSRQYHAMLATPLRVGDVVIGHQAFIGSACS